MAIIPVNEKVFMVSNNTNTTYGGSAALQAMNQWYTMQDVIDTVGGGASYIVNTYPTTTPGSAGTRFWYKGNEWHYMTAAEITSANWTGLVSVGFPAPVVITWNLNIFTDFTGDIAISYNGDRAFTFPAAAAFTTVDTLGFGNPIQVRIFSSTNGQISLIRNAQLLKNLEDVGTDIGINIQWNQFSATALNNFFTDLPSTSVVCTIKVTGNPGAATCNPLIATAKGYTVVTT